MLLMSNLTFKEFQEFIREHYYQYDSQRGTAGTFMWLMEEIGELASALQKCALKEPSPDEEQHLNEEFADVLGWLSTLANMHNVDLEEAVRFKYLNNQDLHGHKG